MLVSLAINAAGCGLNVALYAAHGKPINLGVAVFAGFVALGFAAMLAGGRVR